MADLVQQKDVKLLLSNESYKKRFNELMGERASAFISSIINVSQSSEMMKKAQPETIISSAVVAATLNLPVDKNLGFSWIVPYNNNIGTRDNPRYLVQAQFQMGYKGYVQLALRTGQYLRINVVEVFENQFKSFNSLTEELDADFNIEGKGQIKGYACYFKLVNGFEKTTFWSIEKVRMHGKRYSKNFTTSSSVWSTDFDEMAKKTVLKNTLAKWGILSIDLQKAHLADQAVVQETPNGEEYQYPDNFTDAEVIDEAKHEASESKINEINNQLNDVLTKKGQKAADKEETNVEGTGNLNDLVK